MTLGLCCQFAKTDNTNMWPDKALRFGQFKNNKYDEQKVLDTWIFNLEQLKTKIIPAIKENNIKVFRITSNTFPLFEFFNHLAKESKIESLLSDLKEGFKGIRVTCHPDHFCKLNSDNNQGAIDSLKYHAWLFDSLGLPESYQAPINIHAGAANKKEKFIAEFKKLPDNIKKRLVLENDESCYSVYDLLSIYKELKIPITFDSHHHVFKSDKVKMEDACKAAVRTWGDFKPIQHISNTEPGLENASFHDRRKHSSYIHYVPECQQILVAEDKIDLEVEAKAKQLALLKMRVDFRVI